MKLHYLENYASEVEGYYIENPSAEFKKLYPKKYICVSISNNRVWNVDKRDELPIHTYKIDYLFTYDQDLFKKSSHNLWKWMPERLKKEENWQRVIPADLNNYLIDDKENSDVVIKLVPKSTIEDPRLINAIVIKTKFEFLKTVELKASFEAMIKSIYNDKYLTSIDTTEKWLLNLLSEIPFNLSHRPLLFGKTINDAMFKKEFKPSIDNFVIGYSSRIAKIEDEFKFIKMMETEFSDFKSTDIIIFDDYTNIVDRIEKAAKDKKIEFKRTETSIRLPSEEFYKLNMDFEIINFISC